jgi:5,10-methylenetetrahydrofolate reductase
MPTKSAIFNQNKFIYTTELTPPKGIVLSKLLNTASSLNMIDAFNITDNHNSKMSMAPIGLAMKLIENNMEPIYQITCRDRNSIAIQSDLLAAYSLGINNILCMSGESVKYGDHPNAKDVFDINSEELIETITKLNNGYDYANNKLDSMTNFNIGAVVNPGSDILDKELNKFENKIKNGATFFQTQAIFDPETLQSIIKIKEQKNIKIFAGFIPIKSVKMANYLNTKVPGINVPENIVNLMESTDDPQKTCIEISKEIISEIKGMKGIDGIHIMALGWEHLIPKMI